MSKELGVGHVIAGKYEILRKSGTGSLGDDVYVGTHLDLKKDILIRILPASMTEDKRIAQRFIQGVNLTASLSHPNILPAYDAGEEDGSYFLVTGFEKGFFLKEYLEHRGRLDEKEALGIIIALADALDTAWEKKKIIHRNVCPDTILIARENSPMLTDFGMARQLASMQGLTMTGFTVGNPQYMSPEQITADKELDFRADMYCLGLVFYEILAGHPAFKEKSQVALMAAQTTKQPPPLREENSHVSDTCVKIIGRMIEKDRNKRYISWEELIKDLKSLLQGEKPKEKPAPEKKAQQAHQKSPGESDAEKKLREIKRLLEEDKKRRVKRNITILFVIANIIILAAAAWLLSKKMRPAGGTPPAPAARP